MRCTQPPCERSYRNISTIFRLDSPYGECRRTSGSASRFVFFDHLSFHLQPSSRSSPIVPRRPVPVATASEVVVEAVAVVPAPRPLPSVVALRTPPSSPPRTATSLPSSFLVEAPTPAARSSSATFLSTSPKPRSRFVPIQFIDSALLFGRHRAEPVSDTYDSSHL